MLECGFIKFIFFRSCVPVPSVKPVRCGSLGTATQPICGFNHARRLNCTPRPSSSPWHKLAALAPRCNSTAIIPIAIPLQLFQLRSRRFAVSVQESAAAVGFLISASHRVIGGLVASSTARVSHQKTPRRRLQLGAPSLNWQFTNQPPFPFFEHQIESNQVTFRGDFHFADLSSRNRLSQLDT